MSRVDYGTCAVCADELTEVFTMEPLGRDDAMVKVCPGCANPQPIAIGIERPAYTGGAGVGVASFNKDITAALKAKFGDVEYEQQSARNLRYGQQPARALTREETMLKEYDLDVQRRKHNGQWAKPRAGRRD